MNQLRINTDKTSRRKCGGCTLCCRLLPVEAVPTVANEKCKHQFSGGCRLYGKPHMPVDCWAWHCMWIAGEDTGERPDRSHVVIDCLMDGIRMTLNETGQHEAMPAVQVWCDPEHPHAHRNPKLREWLAVYAKSKSACVIVRYSSAEAIVLFPPWLSEHNPDGGRWVEMASNVRSKGDPTTVEDMKALGMPIVPGRV